MRGSKVSAIQKLCQEAQIEIPTPVAPSTANKKPQSTVLNPLDFTVAPGFFLNDNSAPPVLQSIRGQMHGLGLVTPDQILPWLCENQTISSDELGAVVIGLMPLATDLIAEEVTFPCQDADGQSVLLTGTLVQMGGKKISLTKGDQNRLLRKPMCWWQSLSFRVTFHRAMEWMSSQYPCLHQEVFWQRCHRDWTPFGLGPFSS